MHLVQILLPLYDNQARKFPRSHFETVASEITARFGGLTAYTRSPAQGRWKQRAGTSYDDVIVFEVMVEKLHRSWWKGLRARLERTFRQKEVVIRAQPIELL